MYLKAMFFSFIKKQMKITHYLFFIKLTHCLPTDCYSKFESQIQRESTRQVKVQVKEQEPIVKVKEPSVKEQEPSVKVKEPSVKVKEPIVNSKGGVTSKATFYFRVGENVQGCPDVQTFNDGNRYGPCSENGEQGVKYTENSKYWVAIANAGSRCGDTITVNYGGNSLQLKVMDECPACAIDNHVDMSLEALIELTGSKDNACAINTVLPMITWY
jgi:hypothetical protein